LLFLSEAGLWQNLSAHSEPAMTARKNLTLFNDDAELIDKLKELFEKNTKFKITDVQVVRKALRELAARELVD